MIKDILSKQKRELDSKRKEYYIERKAKIKNIESDIIQVITGPRRAGKSFFVINTIKENFGYANFDDEQLTETKDYDEIISNIDNIYSNPKTIFFDEIQNLEKWELFVNRLQRQGKKIILTGSNSKLLSSELATHLTGRYFETKIYPLSFNEIINKKEKTTAEIKSEFDKYLYNGGYPEPYSKKLDVSEYLKTLFDATLYKDVIKRHKIRKTNELEAIAEFIISNSATQLSYNQIAKSLKVKSVETVKKYCNILEETLMFFSIKKYSNKIREQHTDSKKIYCIDNGIIKAKAFSTSQNQGKLLENVIASELKKTEDKQKIYYWKTQNNEEVDFVIQKNNTIKELIQVCYNTQNKKTEEREIRALIKAGKELKCKKLTIITNDEEKKETREWFGMKGTINYIPAWKWLLEE
ncbi:MAG: ATP-binding protein [Candidatus ainarchaeum sp.]|nr:ATP-binding protein [Candidatus ainarchaeum sp.]